MPTVLEAAIMEALTYDPTNPQLSVPPGWRMGEPQSLPNGYFGRSFTNITTNELVITAAGTNQFRDLIPDAQLAAGQLQTQNFSNTTFARGIIANNPGMKIFLVGHSLGGNLVQVTSIFLGQDGIPTITITFQSPGIPQSIVDGASQGMLGSIFNFRNIADIVSLVGAHAGRVIDLNGGPPVSQYITGLWEDAMTGLAPGGSGILASLGFGLTNTALQAHAMLTTVQYLQSHLALGNYPGEFSSNLAVNLGLKDALASITTPQYDYLVAHGQSQPLFYGSTPDQVHNFLLSTLPPELLVTPASATDIPQTLTVNADGSFTLQTLNGESLTSRTSDDGSVHFNWSRLDGSSGNAVYYPDGSYTNTVNETTGISVTTSFTPPDPFDPSSTGTYNQIWRNADGSVIPENAQVDNSLTDFSTKVPGGPVQSTAGNDFLNGLALDDPSYSLRVNAAYLNGDGLFNVLPSGLVTEFFRPGAEEQSAFNPHSVLNVFDPTLFSQQYTTNPFSGFGALLQTSLAANLYGGASFLLNIDPLVLDLNGDGITLTDYQSQPAGQSRVPDASGLKKLNVFRPPQAKAFS